LFNETISRPLGTAVLTDYVLASHLTTSVGTHASHNGPIANTFNVVVILIASQLK